MTSTTIHQELSPLDQVRRDERLSPSGKLLELSSRDQIGLRQLFATKADCVYNKLFDRPGAEKKIFDDPPPIKRPDTSWYHPVMENLSAQRLPKGNVGTVLLTAAEERALFLQLNFCRWKLAKLRKRPLDTLTAEQAREMLEWHRKSEGYRDQIAQTNLALVLAMAKRTRLSEVDFSDLVSEGNMALLRAIDKFDVARGFKFSTYACRAILKAFSRTGVKLSKYRQVFPTDFDPKLEKSNYLTMKREGHEDDCVDELRKIIRENRAQLTDIEQSVIEHRFALNRPPQPEKEDVPLTLEQVGQIIGVTKERVRQIQNKALEKIRLKLENDFLG